MGGRAMRTGKRRGPAHLGLGLALALVLGAAALAPAGALGDAASLYRGPGSRPGPSILYARPAVAPQLTNVGIWRAPPILVSGASAYRDGEYLYQDFLYDDHGANAGLPDPGDPRASGDTFSRPNGTYTYPTSKVYAGNAADLVELRVKPVAGATAFRITLNTLQDPSLVATTIAIGDSALPRPFPHGANASAPAAMFLTVHGTTADLLDATTGAPAPQAPQVSVDLARRQIQVIVPHADWNPTGQVVRLAAGVGLWDKAAGRYLLPQAAADATHPGGAGVLPHPTAFFNVAFRDQEPLPQLSNPAGVAANPAWWRDAAQGTALRTGNLSSFHDYVDFRKLATGVYDDMSGQPQGVPRTGAIDRILASHFESEQGTDYSTSCGEAKSCRGELRGRLQPYAIYVPPKAPSSGRYGLTLLLHSLGANYNQFSGSRNQSQFGDRSPGSIAITPEGRGPDGWYYDQAGADTFEVWADVAAHYRLDAAYTSIAGYSMGGYGTYKFATQFPDLFAKGQPTVGPPGLGVWVPPAPPSGGQSTNTYRQLASLRNIPFLIWVEASDELVPIAGTQTQARGFDALGYRYEFDTFTPGEHLTLALNDQYAPAARFLGSTKVDRDPAHVTFVRNPTMDFPADGTTADHAYWLSQIALRSGGGSAPLGTIDVRSGGFGTGDPKPSGTKVGGGVLTKGNLPALAFTRQYQFWGPTPRTRTADVLDITARDVATVTVDARRARVDCRAALRIHSDGPIKVRLVDCPRAAAHPRRRHARHHHARHRQRARPRFTG